LEVRNKFIAIDHVSPALERTELKKTLLNLLGGDLPHFPPQLAHDVILDLLNSVKHPNISAEISGRLDVLQICPVARNNLFEQVISLRVLIKVAREQRLEERVKSLQV
jgi:hypothetical protein